MGISYAFECPACGYSAIVSGRDDAGMMGTQTTINCQTCRKLYNVTIGLIIADSPGWQPVPLRCPRGKKHIIQRWRYPGPCPKCGTRMKKGGLRVLWC